MNSNLPALLLVLTLSVVATIALRLAAFLLAH